MVLGFFVALHRAGLVGSLLTIGLPLLMGPASLVVFRLYFAGRRQAFEQALAEDRPALALLQRVVAPSLPVAVLAGVASFVLAGQSVLWPLVFAFRGERFSVSVQALVLAEAQSRPGAGSAAGWLALTWWGLPLLLLWAPLQALVLERYALVRGE